jgi:lipopolysaccharide transport system ATP-binding protein
MTCTAVRTEELGKRYRIGAPRWRHRTLREAIISAAAAPLRNLGRLRPLTSSEPDAGDDTVWAVRDISFEVREGEVVGIIGRNGAGKSTLLKLLSRITSPTIGFADIYGRVGSLLEVGTGFHQELTGRDNIYLSGSILGMDRGYIDRRFDEIVDFAGIGPFLDTPVKRYSSGMYLRIAFAVAAHLEPDVLIVDEVLAVGDAEFQKKCLGVMDTVAQEGRTVLFVSHDMNAIRRLCPRALLLDHGRLLSDGNAIELIENYLISSLCESKPASRVDTSMVPRMGSGEARFEAVEYGSDRADLGYSPYPDGPLHFMLSILADGARTIGSLGVTIYDQNGTKLVNADTLSRRGIEAREGAQCHEAEHRSSPPSAGCVSGRPLAV